MSSDSDNRSSVVSVGDHQFRIGDQTSSVYGAAVDYYRLDRDQWGTVLDSVKDADCTAVSPYIPWGVHEIEKGEFDFGEDDPSNDLDGFLTMCEDRDLDILARPGPQINAELLWFGYPRRILENEELHALGAQGNMAVLTQLPHSVPALSYAADEFFEEVALWYDAVCSILSDHAYPDGRLVATQVDNEMAYFFNVNAYAADFSDASIDNYRAFLADKYDGIEALNETYGQNAASFNNVEPPRRFEGTQKEDIPYYADWAEYRERYLVDSLDRLAGMLDERGLNDIPLFHNYPHPLNPGGASSGITTPFNVVALEEKLDFVGWDIYSSKELYDQVKRVVSYLAASSRYPYNPELIAGTWPWYMDPGTVEDEEFVVKATLMHGIEGFTRYMFTERDRWMASPVQRNGDVRDDKYDVSRRINRMAAEHDFEDLRRQGDVLLLADRDYDRLEAASVLVSFPGDFLETPSTFSEYPNHMTVSEDTLGFEEPIQLEKSDWFSACYEGLTNAECDFLLSDTALPPDEWDQYEALVVTSFEYMNAAVQRGLVEFAEAGGSVVMGPRIPHLDERMNEDETVSSALSSADSRSLTAAGTAVGTTYSVGDGHIIHATDLTEATRMFKAALDERDLLQVGKNDDRLDTAIHRDTESERVVVFVANPTTETIDAEVTVNIDIESVRELWDDREIAVNASTVQDELPSYTIRIYECTLPSEAE